MGGNGIKAKCQRKFFDVNVNSCKRCLTRKCKQNEDIQSQNQGNKYETNKKMKRIPKAIEF